MAQWDPAATSYTYPISMVNKLAFLIETNDSTVVCSVTPLERYRSPSPVNHTVWTE